MKRSTIAIYPAALTTFFACLLLCYQMNAQVAWTVEQKTDMPEAVSNNAVAAAKSADGKTYLYSFGGIDETKAWSGIHNRSYRYDVLLESWESIPDLPMSTPVIAAGATNIQEKIYILGGYSVNMLSQEVSSNQLFEYDPTSNTYTEKASLPRATDDHVQVAYKDSLLYVISGWSNNGNIVDVQIYNPALDEWQIGTPLPNLSEYGAFGASGAMLDDTIYYAGGATVVGFNFTLKPLLRKGYVHPDDPTQIDWSVQEMEHALGYRMASLALNFDDTDGIIYWIGGSDISYNFDGIAYSNGQGVPATGDIREYDRGSGLFQRLEGVIQPTMDLRGIGQIGLGNFMIAGGMGENQTVHGQTLELNAGVFLGLDEETSEQASFIKTVSADYVKLKTAFTNSGYQIYSTSGQLMKQGKSEGGTISVSNLVRGTYLLSLKDQKRAERFIIQ